MQIDFYPVDVSYSVVRDKPVIRLFSRSLAGEQVCVTVEGFRPYCIAASPSLNHQELQAAIEAIPVLKESQRLALEFEPVQRRLKGRELCCIKLIANLPEDIPLIRETLKSRDFTIFEADIPFARRFLIDNDIIPLTLCRAEGEFVQQHLKVPSFLTTKVEKLTDSLLEHPRVLAFDIETHSPLGKFAMPDENPIIMIGFAGQSFQKVITWKTFKTDLDFVEFVQSELELIEKFKEIIDAYKPDILVGYYSDGFDLPYITARAEKYKIELDIGLDYARPRFHKGQVPSVELGGVVHLDIFKFIRRVMSRSMETSALDLDSVSKELLDESKEEIDFEEMNRVWQSSPEELGKYCKYNLQDALLTFKLCSMLLPNISEFVKILGLPIFDVSRMSFSQLVEWHLIKQSGMFGELIPNKPDNSETRQRKFSTYEGAFVFEPEPGIYGRSAVFDFRSLYPTIISAHNISPDTIGCACCPGQSFCTKKRGFIASVIEDLIKRRMRIKEMLKAKASDKLLAARQEALKTLANSMYGYLGFFAARWYSIECARSITQLGREYIQKVIASAGSAGFKVLYSDTDSIFLLVGDMPEWSVLEFAAGINKTLPDLMELNLEGFYQSAIFVGTKSGSGGAKKKYALLSEQGIVKIKGFETVRRNTSIIAKEVQETILRMLLTEMNQKNAVEYVKNIIAGLKRKEIPLQKVVMSTQLRQDIESYDSVGPHVAAAKRLREQGKHVGPGSLISYVITQGKEKISLRARLPDEITAEEYDADYYINNQVLPAVLKILEVFGVKEEDLLQKDQSKLDSFF